MLQQNHAAVNKIIKCSIIRNTTTMDVSQYTVTVAVLQVASSCRISINLNLAVSPTLTLTCSYMVSPFQ